MFLNVNEIFSISDASSFEEMCIQVFQYQYLNNNVYKDFCDLILKKSYRDVQSIYQIPFLPIRFFKTHKIYASQTAPQKIFTSSSTTGNIPSKHYVANLNLYTQSYLKSFEMFYGPIEDYCVLALLPSYLEREGSSLIFMVEDLIKRSKDPDSGFFLYDHNKLVDILVRKDSEKKVLLLGVTFALLDFAEKFNLNLKNTLVMETGGMKGRKEEQTRQQVHEQLCRAFNTTNIHSEYGMTELLSQAYSKENGLFSCPPWMKILIRETSDPLNYLPDGKQGALNIIDLANVYSCSFLATDDMGRTSNTFFEVNGRLDNSEIRGCNLMIK